MIELNLDTALEDQVMCVVSYYSKCLELLKKKKVGRSEKKK